MIPPVDFNRHVYRILLAATIAIIALGTLLFHRVEHLGWINAFYFCVVTLATVGYGDITPKTNAGKLLTVIYIFIGVGILTTFISYSVRRRASKVQDKRDHKNRQ